MNALTITEFEKEAQNALILDLRNKYVFEIGFIPHSINIGIDGDYKTYLSKITEKDRKMVLVCSDKLEKESTKLLIKQGYTNIAGWLNGGFENWKQSHKPIDMLINIPADEFATDLYFLNEHEAVIDIREFEARKEGEVENSLNISLNELTERIEDIDKSKSYYVIGSDGFGTMLAASYLKSQGCTSVKSIDASFSEIQEALMYHKRV
ncbi:MAG: rhodanese-like domain-containing protein [Bacteroidia bacterium]|nr:rhodanese-like domain-containing protein [Bacteroidia bacterium]MCO5253528.1 rhodanese-like domain-containing protein [Bacteroidota bacterium]MCZ2129643.1 rhodanese-like domain-containing protein [Bacteroidia bacterium]